MPKVTIMRNDFRNPGEGIDFFEDILNTLGIPENTWDNLTEITFNCLTDSDFEVE